MFGADAESNTFRDEQLIKLVADGFVARERVVAGEPIAKIAKERGHTPQWTGRLVRIGWLPPQLVKAIVDGKQPKGLTRRVLSSSDFDAEKWIGKLGASAASRERDLAKANTS